MRISHDNRYIYICIYIIFFLDKKCIKYIFNYICFNSFFEENICVPILTYQISKKKNTFLYIWFNFLSTMISISE
ncbi:LOW QUALITY PROTEIN: hypothetical protein PanWU01x14_036750 [Parasponia andersonii]|uniref:Uncharacterized protein n=1 Tax=Parasponia andersonii TaxID=3476 RepID=A0A2P5DSI6_PARAD|nr:LOW QUALITY PROTEIN: hypothetical protein PanWU01x14_036750 [Parasponia andersonii]